MRRAPTKGRVIFSSLSPLLRRWAEALFFLFNIHSPRDVLGPPLGVSCFAYSYQTTTRCVFFFSFPAHVFFSFS